MTFLEAWEVLENFDDQSRISTQNTNGLFRVVTGNTWLLLHFCIILKFRITKVFPFTSELSACLMLSPLLFFLHWMQLASVASFNSEWEEQNDSVADTAGIHILTGCSTWTSYACLGTISFSICPICFLFRKDSRICSAGLWHPRGGLPQPLRFGQHYCSLQTFQLHRTEQEGRLPEISLQCFAPGWNFARLHVGIRMSW